jgi:hypothetical protein
MAAFEVMCEGFLGISAHWDLFQYFFRFTCLRDSSRAATIGCANLRTKQGRDDDYIPMTLTNSKSGWHKGWFYLWNGPEHALPSYTGFSIAKSQRNWADGPPQEGAGEDAQASLGRAGVPAKRRDHLGGSGRAVPCPRSCVAPKAAAPPLRSDDRQGPLGGDCDRAGAPVAA